MICIRACGGLDLHLRDITISLDGKLLTYGSGLVLLIVYWLAMRIFVFLDNGAKLVGMLNKYSIPVAASGI